MISTTTLNRFVRTSKLDQILKLIDRFGVPFLTVGCIFLIISQTNYNTNYDKANSPITSGKKIIKGYVAMGATPNPAYLFPLPITVLAWKQLGLESIVCFAGSEREYTENKATNIVIKMLQELEVQMIFLVTKKAPPHTVSQTCRMYLPAAEGIQLTDDAVVITSDTDIWAFHEENHLPQEPYKMHLYNSECCTMKTKPNETFKFRMYPMSTIAMSAQLWRQLLNVSAGWLTDGDVLAERLYEEFNVEYIRDGKGKPHFTASWNADQLLISDKIAQWKLEYENNNASISRTPKVKGRIDRVSWNGNSPSLNLDSHMDAHILHPLHAANKWKSTLPLLKKMFDRETMQRIREYRQRFAEEIEKQ